MVQTQLGKLYRVDRAFTMPFWSYLSIVPGDGTVRQISTPYLTGANYFRVFELP